jgi:hypothetical protein
LPSAIDEIDGALGTFAGVTVADVAEDAALSPTEFTARSRIVYVVPLVRPLICKGLVVRPEDCHVEPLSVEYSMSVIAAPPFAPREKATLAERSRVVVELIDGASGTTLAVAHRSADAAPLPTTLTALTWTQYSWLDNDVEPSLESLLIEIGDVVPVPSPRARQVAPRSVEYS